MYGKRHHESKTNECISSQRMHKDNKRRVQTFLIYLLCESRTGWDVVCMGVHISRGGGRWFEYSLGTKIVVHSKMPTTISLMIWTDRNCLSALDLRSHIYEISITCNPNPAAIYSKYHLLVSYYLVPKYLFTAFTYYVINRWFLLILSKCQRTFQHEYRRVKFFLYKICFESYE